MAAIAGGTAALLAAARRARRRVRVLVAAVERDLRRRRRLAAVGDARRCARAAPTASRSSRRTGSCGALRAHHGRFLVSAITYNHESPRRPERFLPRKVSAGVAAIAAGRAETLTLGDLDAVRDWSHARDVVEGMVLALRHDEPGDYVFASGVGRTVGELVDAAFAAAGVERAGPTAATASRSTRASCARPRRARRSATRRGRATCSAGSRSTSFEQLVARDGRGGPRAARRGAA